MRIHPVDPHPPGPGRVWRHEQSALLRMNLMAEDVTMFTDESSTSEGPVRPGPSPAEWAAQFSGRSPCQAPYTEPADPEVLAELRTRAGRDVPTAVPRAPPWTGCSAGRWPSCRPRSQSNGTPPPRPPSPAPLTELQRWDFSRILSAARKEALARWRGRHRRNGGTIDARSSTPGGGRHV
ncbi:FAD/NAD(P)-binding protein [Streptomyces tibetensis]|uniref:FAD/NAD(P)-binding protein n=1 Tax=Streptomyces tibetensis TaxID=2382123 RepID=UPI0033CC70D3